MTPIAPLENSILRLSEGVTGGYRLGEDTPAHQARHFIAVTRSLS